MFSEKAIKTPQAIEPGAGSPEPGTEKKRAQRVYDTPDRNRKVVFGAASGSANGGSGGLVLVRRLVCRPVHVQRSADQLAEIASPQGPGCEAGRRFQRTIVQPAEIIALGRGSRSDTRICRECPGRSSFGIPPAGATASYSLSETCSPSCSLITSAISLCSVLPSFNVNASDASFQSSLKLCTRAETQICRTGAFGLTTNFAGGSSNSIESAPALWSTSKS